MVDTRHVSSILEETSIHLGTILDALNIFADNVEDEIDGWAKLSRDPCLKQFKAQYATLSSILTLATYRIGNISRELETLSMEYLKAEREAQKTEQ